MTKPKILFIDAYDSFSNNIIDLIEGSLDVSVTKLKIDSHLPSDLYDSYAAVIIGPGPGSPYNQADVGCAKDIWDLPDHRLIPVFGICLGFQSLVEHFGGNVQRLPYPRHGIETDIQCCNDSIFEGIKTLRSVQYHSLHGSIGDSPIQEDLWTPNKVCPDLIPLAWDVDHPYSRGPPTPEDPRASLGTFNPRHILMSVKHATKPFYGVQFHLESICSSAEARQVVSNWWQVASQWNRQHRGAFCHPGPDIGLSSKPFFSKMIDVGNLDVRLVRERLSPASAEIIVLDSEMSQSSPLGNYSIIGLVYPDTLRITYQAGAEHVSLIEDQKATIQSLDPYGNNVFAYLKTFMEAKKQLNGDKRSPFWGGLMGNITYEACLETLNIPRTSRVHPSRPDIQFAFVERSIVIDHTTRKVHIQSIKEGDIQWVDNTSSYLEDLASPSLRLPEILGQNSQTLSTNGSSALSGSPSPGDVTPAISVETVEEEDAYQPPKSTLPTEASYCRKIQECQVEIRQGNSYELCLTGQTRIDIPTPTLSTWSRYLRLRAKNPAPFGAYISLGPLQVLSSSPERFMSWSRPNAQDESICQFRPIKGTVKKRPIMADGSVGFVDLATATEILSSPKERAENLMIVDLIRHDLAGVVGSGNNVQTKSLMQVEEYETVYQLVTVIEGTLKPELSRSLEIDGIEPRKSGVDVLAASLPPGSMTGAPKKRSCELLQGIEENTARSVYSGVLGYMEVGGSGDFSVVIRTAYRWDDECTNDGEVWRIGAGGAITDMSTEQGEWDEMITKMDAVLRSFI